MCCVFNSASADRMDNTTAGDSAARISHFGVRCDPAKRGRGAALVILETRGGDPWHAIGCRRCSRQAWASWH